MSTVTFARNLVKGKIAETIFAQMLRETRTFTVLEFGYEKVIPELIQQDCQENNGMIETLRTAPDFAVINQCTKEVKLIEVKYLRTLSSEYVLGYAERMSASWNPSYLFVATLDGFYFDEINKIIIGEGVIAPFGNELVSRDLQVRYLKILQDFEANG